MIPDLPAPTLVEDRASLERLLRRLEDEREIGVDTEADSFFSYREKVCLIQVTAGGEDYLLDPLAEGVDVALLGPVLADPAKTKVFHDGEYDVLILKREYGLDFAGLFDTRIAASALGVSSPGLASVLSERFGVELDKSQQRSNWGARPLTKEQVRYARFDTHFLLRLMHEQRAELEERGRMRIVEGECRRLEELEPPTVGFEPDEWVRLKGARTLSPRQRALLRELFILRDRLAHERDQPPFRIVNNPVLVRIAAAQPRSSQELAEVDGISWRQVRRIGDQILEALKRGEKKPEIKALPQLPARDGTSVLSLEQLERYDELKAWRKRRAEREGYDASLVLNRHALLRLAQDQPKSLDALRKVPGVLDWQVEEFGEALVALFQKRPSGARRANAPRRRGGR